MCYEGNEIFVRKLDVSVPTVSRNSKLIIKNVRSYYTVPKLACDTLYKCSKGNGSDAGAASTLAKRKVNTGNEPNIFNQI